MARSILGIIVLALAPHVALAQSTPATPAPPGTLEAPPEKIEPPPAGGAAPGTDLSDQLQRSQGVIKPPAGVDPGAVAPTPPPEQFPTPVVPPGAAPQQQQP